MKLSSVTGPLNCPVSSSNVLNPVPPSIVLASVNTALLLASPVPAAGKAFPSLRESFPAPARIVVLPENVTGVADPVF